MPIDLEVPIYLLRWDLVIGAEIVEVAKGIVVILKRVVIMGVNTGKMQLYLLAFMLYL